MTGQLLAHEVRRVGGPVLGIPAAAALLAGVAIAAVSGGGLTGRLVPAVVEALPALASGVAVAAVIGRDPARELQLSLPTGYGRTLGHRLAPVVVATIAGAVLPTVAAVASGRWPAAPDVLTAQLVWLAPTAFLTALAALFTGRPWQPLYLFADGIVPAAPFHDATGPTAAWWHDRLVLCLAALLCAGLAAVLARRPERLLRGGA